MRIGFNDVFQAMKANKYLGKPIRDHYYGSLELEISQEQRDILYDAGIMFYEIDDDGLEKGCFGKAINY